MELEELNERIAIAEEQLKIVQLRAKAQSDKLERLCAERQKVCQHPETITEDSYFSGSYYDRASTSYRTVCCCCKMVLKRWEVTHSYYG
jgi:hypothetical protein